MIDLDATLLTSHSDKAGAEPTWKRGYGFHPVLPTAIRPVRRWWASCAGLVPSGSGDVFYCAQPVCHIDTRWWVASAIRRRVTLALAKRFSVSRFRDDIREHGATHFTAIGTMLWLCTSSRPGQRP